MKLKKSVKIYSHYLRYNTKSDCNYYYKEGEYFGHQYCFVYLKNIYNLFKDNVDKKENIKNKEKNIKQEININNKDRYVNYNVLESAIKNNLNINEDKLVYLKLKKINRNYYITFVVEDDEIVIYLKNEFVKNFLYFLDTNNYNLIKKEIFVGIDENDYKRIMKEYFVLKEQERIEEENNEGCKKNSLNITREKLSYRIENLIACKYVFLNVFYKKMLIGQIMSSDIDPEIIKKDFKLSETAEPKSEL